MKIISWNVNSIRARIELLFHLIHNSRPDVILLQESKATHETFPFLELEDLGYKSWLNGQKSYNGVAIISRHEVEDIVMGLDDFDNLEARYIEGVVNAGGIVCRVASVYVPNGKEVRSEKFLYKLDFFKSLHEHLRKKKRYEEAFFIGGDYNVAPDDVDVYDAKELDGTLGFHIEERRAIKRIMNDGFYDTFRMRNPRSVEYSWWDYRGNGVRDNKGMRIDLILASAPGMDLVSEASMLKQYRGMERPSDHIPVEILLDKGQI